MSHLKQSHIKTITNKDSRTSRNITLMLAAVAFIGLFIAFSSAHAAGTYEKPKPAEVSKTHASYTKARSYLADNNYQKALDALAITIKDEPKNADAWNLKGFSHRKLGQYDASMTAYQTALKLNPKHTGALEYMGELYLTLGNLPEAEALLVRLNKACSFNCKDRDALKQAIANYKKTNG